MAKRIAQASETRAAFQIGHWGKDFRAGVNGTTKGRVGFLGRGIAELKRNRRSPEGGRRWDRSSTVFGKLVREEDQGIMDPENGVADAAAVVRRHLVHDHRAESGLIKVQRLVAPRHGQ